MKAGDRFPRFASLFCAVLNVVSIALILTAYAKSGADGLVIMEAGFIFMNGLTCLMYLIDAFRLDKKRKELLFNRLTSLNTRQASAFSVLMQYWSFRF